MAESRPNTLVTTERQNLRTSSAITIGISTVLAFLGGLFAWSSLAPLESAALAPGFVSIESHRKTIKHLEGGIVRTVLVREGDRVSPGQRLIVLDPTRARADLEAVRGRQAALIAMEARLIAEKSEQPRIDFPEELGSKIGNVELAEIIDGEISIFETHRQTLTSRILVLRQQDLQLSELIKGLKKNILAQDKQLHVTREEIDLYQVLLDKGLTQKPRLLELQFREAEIEGRRSQSQAEIARAEQRMGETTLRIADFRTGRKNEIAEKLRSVQIELFDLEAPITVAEDVLKRTVVTSPIDGTVVALKIHTPGGVINPGDPLLDIVPTDDRLLIDARIDPRDIDVVRPGLLAKVHLTAFNRRHVRPLQGQVMSVSADRLIEDRSGEAYYLARIKLTETRSDIFDEIPLYPGMPAEIMIITGTRTALDYLFEPITRSFNLAFRGD